MTLVPLMQRIANGQTLTQGESRTLADGFFDGTLGEEGMKDVLLSLNAKGETVEELAGFAESMRSHSVRITPKVRVVDTCGTGGDCSHTFNISTAAAFVVAAGGVAVAKHGNKSVSSSSGSADVLQALGANISTTPEKTTRLIEETGFGFLFAPLYHPAMKRVAPVRKALGVRTCFNLLGPLTNPAGAKIQVIGAYNTAAQYKIAEAARRLGTEKTLVIHCNGLDEASLGETRILEVTPEGISESFASSDDLGINGTLSELRVENPQESASKIREALKGGCFGSEIIALNTGLAFFAAGRAKNIKEGVGLARKTIASGAALSKLEEYVEASNK